MGEKKEVAICRICLICDFDIPGKGLYLFEEYNDCLIADKINALTNVSIKASDGLPDSICPACLVELESAYSFKIKCEKTNEILLSAVNNDPIKVEIFDTSIPNKEEEFSNDKTTVAFPVKEEELDDDNFEIVLPKEQNDLLDKNLDITQPNNEAYHEDSGDFDDEDIEENNTTQSDLQADGADIKPQVELSRPSKAIDLQLECHDCGGFFKSKCKLRVHWKRVHLPENIKCPKCFLKFKSYAALNSHKKKNPKSCAIASKVHIEGEGKNRIFHCKDCDYKSQKIQVFDRHIAIHTGERPFQCNLCPRAFTQQGTLGSHMETVHKLYRYKGTCQICGKYILGRDKFNAHVNRHKNVSCKICNAVLKGRSGLLIHMQRHSGTKAYACEVCGMSFYTASELWCHRNKKHLKIKKAFICEICNYTCGKNYILAKHKAKHTATNVGCDVCGIFLDNKQQMVFHKIRHTEKNYQCSECEKVFYSKSLVSKHITKIHRFVKVGCEQKKTNKK